MTKSDLIALLDAVSELYGLEKAVLRVFARIESNFDTKAHNAGSGAAGLFQYLKSTAAEENIDPYDPLEAATATAKRIRRDAQVLEKRGIEPNAAHLYLCHQQGRAGFFSIYRAAIEEEVPLPAVRHWTMAANLPSKERVAMAGLPTDHEKANFFLNHWRAKIKKFVAEVA